MSRHIGGVMEGSGFDEVVTAYGNDDYLLGSGPIASRGGWVLDALGAGWRVWARGMARDAVFNPAAGPIQCGWVQVSGWAPIQHGLVLHWGGKVMDDELESESLESLMPSRGKVGKTGVSVLQAVDKLSRKRHGIPPSLSDVARELDCSRQRVHVLVLRLRKHGYMEQLPYRQCARSLQLTAAGRALIASSA